MIFAILPGAIERLRDARAPYAARRLRVRAEHGEGRAGGAVAGHGAEFVRTVAPVVVAWRGRVVAVGVEGVHELGDALALAHGGEGLSVEGVARIEQKIGDAALGAIENRQSVKAHSAGALACVVAVLVAAIILKKTKPFSGKPAPFVMELPQYHIPQVKTVLLHVWERLKGFIIKAGTILFLACVVMWFLGGFGFTDGGFGMVEDSADSLMAAIGGVIAPIFAPLGFGEWQPVAASISGFTAKEAIVSTMGVLANVAGDTEDAVNVAAGVASWFPTGIAAFSFLMFNLLDSPCLAAIATMAKEMNDRKWFWFAILFQNIFAYVVCLCFYQIGSFVTGGAFGFGTVVGFVVLIVMLFLLFRPDPYKDQKVYSKRSVQA